MSEALKATLRAAREILANASEPEWRHEQAQRIIDRHSHVDAKIDAAATTRANLLTAARIARSLGLPVKSSKDREGRVSSYYIGAGAKKMRISDHALPATAKREAQADFHGGRSAHIAEFIVDEGMTGDLIRAEIVATFKL